VRSVHCLSSLQSAYPGPNQLPRLSISKGIAHANAFGAARLEADGETSADSLRLFHRFGQRPRALAPQAPLM